VTAATTQLTVRVILTPPPAAQPAAVSQYRWDRILLVATLSIVAIAFAITAVPPATAPMIATETSGFSPVDVVPPATNMAELVEVETHATPHAAKARTHIAASADTPAPDVAVKPPAPTEVLSDQSPKPALTAGPTHILSGHVRRFVITNGVRSNEPLGSISEITQDPAVAGLLKVYAYADVKNLRGQTLRYRWLQDNAIAADIEIEVGSDHWRSYTSKYLNAQMRGPWRVELRTSDDQLLASTDFEY